MQELEKILIAITPVLTIWLLFQFMKLKKRFDIAERMLAWKNILTFKETEWNNLPPEVKKFVKEINK